MSGKPVLTLDWCSHAAATYAVEHWHYAKIVPKGFPHVRVGVWEDACFIGCVLFGRGGCSELLSPYGLTVVDGAELVRVALRDHAWPVSRIVRIALRMLKNHCPGLRLIVSFADPVQGHTGSIYQAMGWVYTGCSSPDAYYLDAHGRKWHSRNVSESGIKLNYGRPTRSAKPSECTKVVTPGKHRYLYPLDAAMRAQILPLGQPYPKRAGSIASDAPPLQGGEGSAHLTPALSDGLHIQDVH